MFALVSRRGYIIGDVKSAADIIRKHGKRLFLIPKDVLKEVTRPRGDAKVAPMSKAELVKELQEGGNGINQPLQLSFKFF